MRVSRATLCPLGQPKKAIGHEPLIGPWLANAATVTLVSFGSRFGPSRLQDHLGGGSQWHRFAQRSQTGIARPSRGAGCRDMCSQRWTAGEVFLLTSPFI